MGKQLLINLTILPKDFLSKDENEISISLFFNKKLNFICILNILTMIENIWKNPVKFIALKNRHGNFFF